jgi:hypothetical protein
LPNGSLSEIFYEIKKMNKYLALWNTCPTVKQTGSIFKSKKFLLMYFCIFLPFIVYQYTTLKMTIKNDFSSIDKAFENFVKHKTTIITYAGMKIINNKIFSQKFISDFLNDLQNINIFSDRDLSFSESSLIWVTEELIPVGAFGILNQNIYQPNQDFIETCQNSESITFSTPYKDNTFTNAIFMDVCLMFKKNNKRFGFLIMHHNLQEMVNDILPIELIKKYQITLAFDPSEMTPPPLTKNPTKTTPNIDSFILKNALNMTTRKKAYIHPIDNIPVVFLNMNILIPNIFIASLKYTSYILLFNFSLLFIAFWIKNYVFLTTQKMLHILFRINKVHLKNSIDFPFEQNQNLLNNFKSSVKFIKRLMSDFENEKRQLVNQKNLVLEKAKENKKLEDTVQQQYKFLNLVKHYFTENIKFKKAIGKHLYSLLFNTIKEAHDVLHVNNTVFIKDIVTKQRMQTIDTNLKNIFNSNLESKKEFLEPSAVLNEAISAIMIHAIFRNVEIKISTKGTMDKIYLKKQKFQMIISGLVFQSIDATPKDGKIFISSQRIIRNKKDFLAITIEDDSYQTYKNSMCDFFINEQMTMEHIEHLVKQENGTLEFNHNPKCGKKINVLFPYTTHEMEGKNESNVYQLF